MMPYTDATETMATYKERLTNETRWDGGLTDWDVIGNTVITHWDMTTTAYADETGTAPTYTEE